VSNERHDNDPALCEGLFWKHHQWEKWKQENVKRTVWKDGAWREWIETVQRRKCLRCGFQQAHALL
jgi:hypothetical protein